MSPLRREPALIERVATVIREAHRSTPSLRSMVLVTEDGFPVVAVEDATASRFASMTSSVQALADAVMLEVGQREADHIVIAGERGHVLQLRLPGDPWLLAASFDDHENLGKALAVSRRVVAELSSLVQAARLGLAQAQDVPSDLPGPAAPSNAPVAARDAVAVAEDAARASDTLSGPPTH